MRTSTKFGAFKNSDSNVVMLPLLLYVSSVFIQCKCILADLGTCRFNPSQRLLRICQHVEQTRSILQGLGVLFSVSISVSVSVSSLSRCSSCSSWHWIS